MQAEDQVLFQVLGAGEKPLILCEHEKRAEKLPLSPPELL